MSKEGGPSRSMRSARIAAELHKRYVADKSPATHESETNDDRDEEDTKPAGAWHPLMRGTGYSTRGEKGEKQKAGKKKQKMENPAGVYRKPNGDRV